MKKKYQIKLLDAFRRMNAIYFIAGLWKTKNSDVNGSASFSQYFYFVLFTSSMIAVLVEACTTDDNDASVFLIVTVLIGVIQIYRLYYIIWKQHKIIGLMNASSANSTNDYESFCAAEKKLKNLTTFAKYFLGTTFFTFVFVTFVPLIKRRLIFDIAFPLDYKTDDSAFWMAYLFVAATFLLSVTCCLVTSMIWYIMLNFVIKFELLGSEFQYLGLVRSGEQETNSLTNCQANQKLYLRQLIDAIKNLENINELLEDFATTFSSLFLLQIVTSSICICGGVYNLAFSSHDDAIQDGFYSIVLFYCFFDTFSVMYLGNEIMLCSDRLSYCLFESIWMEQTQSCKLNILIVTERLKQPQQLIVGKLFPMTLESFTIIVKRSYSMFNILQNFRT